MIWILIVAGVISSALGEAIDAVAILAIGRPQRRDRLLSGIRREKSIATLKQLTAPEAAVRREGKVLLIPAAEIVTGDILVRAAVELIAADIRLLAASALECTEAVLTGESKVVKKSPAMLAAAEVPVGDCTNRVFMGTGVATSSGEGVVVATAMQTALGRIAGLLDVAGVTTALRAPPSSNQSVRRSVLPELSGSSPPRRGAGAQPPQDRNLPRARPIPR